MINIYYFALVKETTWFKYRFDTKNNKL